MNSCFCHICLFFNNNMNNTLKFQAASRYYFMITELALMTHECSEFCFKKVYMIMMIYCQFILRKQTRCHIFGYNMKRHRFEFQHI